MTMNEADIEAIIALLSPERLDYIKNRTDSKPLIIKIHQETLSLNGALMSIVGMIEIALRNTVYQNLDQHFAVKNWLFHPPAPFEWRDSEKRRLTKALEHARDAKISKIKRKNRRNIIRNKISISDGDMIAQLTFGFWKRMYALEYEHYLWRPALRHAFPNTRITRANIAKNLQTIYQTRNRLAHHERILPKQFYQTIAAIQFIIQNLNQPAQTPNSPLSKLLSNDINATIAKADKLYALMSKPATP